MCLHLELIRKRALVSFQYRRDIKTNTFYLLALSLLQILIKFNIMTGRKFNGKQVQKMATSLVSNYLKLNKHVGTTINTISKVRNSLDTFSKVRNSLDTLSKTRDNILINGKLNVHYNVSVMKNNSAQQSSKIKVPTCKLTEDLGALLNSKEFADVRIITCDNQIIPVHKNILSARSKVFAEMFENPMEETRENYIPINDFSFDVVMELLRFMYTGKAPNLKEMPFDLLAAADKYKLDTLKAMCAVFMIDNLSIETADIVLKTADLYNIMELKSEALNFIENNIDKVDATANWRNITTDRKLGLNISLSSEEHVKSDDICTPK